MVNQQTGRYGKQVMQNVLAMNMHVKHAEGCLQAYNQGLDHSKT